MKILLASIRILIIVGIVALAAEFFLGTEQQSAVLEHREVSIFLVFLTIVLIAMEMVLDKVEEIGESLISDQQRALRENQQEESWLHRFYAKMIDQKSIEEEKDIVLDHDYDGIKELDNNLPPWWVYLFYSTILFAFIYMTYYTFVGSSQIDEFNQEKEDARIAIEEYKKANPNLIDSSNVTLLTDEAEIGLGKEVFQANCVACHAPDGGGGIGPNLTDQYWILGGGIKNVFNTVYNGGREGKGMVPWKGVLSSKQIQQVASYILSLQGTTPMSPKEPQGDIWKEQ